MNLDWILFELNFNISIFFKNIFTSFKILFLELFNLIFNFSKGEYFNSYFFTYISSQVPFNNSFIYSIKFLFSILFLIFIRAGVPRYRYDYLTKLGWNKFLVFSLFILISFFLVFLII